MSALVTGPPAGLPAFDERGFRARAEAVLASAGVPDAELSIALVDDEAIRALNDRYRGRPRPTDVLSFSLLEGPHAEQRGAMLGDVVIAVPYAAAQAEARGHGLDEELLRLLIHGVLHLLGFDHEREAEARAMEARERAIWSEVAG